MNVLIMGCGRVGAQLASLLDAEGHKVTVLDVDAHSFRRLPPTFGGMALVGDGTSEDSLKEAGIEEADAFVAVTQGDNRNVMAAQIARQIFNVPKVVCRIYDPLRKDIYESLGLEAISPTTVFAELLKEKLLGNS
ncbi:MAG: TrkA family potassium uptake protein [Chloroflexi bacterium]|nr:TrkA family potassium uptake protein [Chloroflexota bacterium]MBM3154991.1 TrkA family potassium uptake protein [Chloroflexota bacterium]MBM3172913.1 TrkA family potassium uptake protein [Chloroflexota bacterium]MBM3175243.1 TrkA family potassium uptake protein [Chloroflexota bacterium]MBM4451203.1 TrkA family potassium uptake protein [Chloroflexota bacterium]